jgi:hypothetical protein
VNYLIENLKNPDNAEENEAISEFIRNKDAVRKFMEFKRQ